MNVLRHVARQAFYLDDFLRQPDVQNIFAVKMGEFLTIEKQAHKIGVLPRIDGDAFDLG